MTMSKVISAAVATTALIVSSMTPAIAAPINAAPVQAAPIDAGAIVWTADAETAERYRGNRRYRGYRGHRRHRNRIDGGDVVAGILILGGIAAIAGAASKNKRDRRYEGRDYRTDNRRNDNRRQSAPTNQAGGSIDGAVSACSSAAERAAGDNARVSEIRSITRDGNGWRVEGNLANSAQPTFQCGATNGQVDFVQLGAENLAYNN